MAAWYCRRSGVSGAGFINVYHTMLLRKSIYRRLLQARNPIIGRVIPGLILSSSRTRFVGPQLQQVPQRKARGFHSTAAMANNSAVKQVLTPTLINDVHKLWFSHLGDESSLIMPEGSEMGKWFSKDEEFDQACVAQFRPALETIISSEASASDILNAITPSSPMDWLNIILLLDQIPRNCYRGDESKVVFGRFDPLAEAIALQALEQDIPTQSPHFKYRLAYRTWFYMPLMHSESLAVHEQAIKVHEAIARDMNELLARDPSTLTEEEARCHTVLSNKSEALQNFLTQTSDFEKRHKVIIEQFGRYPHRNQALGRKSTPEETEYLENGGDTFG